MRSRLISLAVVLVLLLTATVGATTVQNSRPPSIPAPPVEESFDADISMRDGVVLGADVYLPAASNGSERWPTILIRTPYNRKLPAASNYRSFVRHGYAVVIQDLRGRFTSKGEFSLVSQEGPDGNDTVNWIAGQRWSNGRVAMAGASFLGITQWWAAIENNPHLLAISPVNSGDDEYLDRYYSSGGNIKLGHRLVWFALNLKPRSNTPLQPGAYLWHLPTRTSDVSATGLALPQWRSPLNHPSYDSFWKAQSIREQLKQIHCPVLSFGGWFDNYAESDLDAFSRLALGHKQVDTWIGPWGHNIGVKFPTRDFGHQAEMSIRVKQTEWFDKLVKARVNPDLREPISPSLHLFVMGPNSWREEHEWPLSRTHYTPLYLLSGGNANSASGDGLLRWQPVMKSREDGFTYDPRNPVPTSGGSICCDPNIFPPGPLDQRNVENRTDVLVYTSAPLTEDIEVTGPVRTVLYVSTSANDTDFTAKLVDVQPDGRPLLVTDGIQRLRYRLSLDKPVLVKRNTAYQISVDTGVTSYVFAPGHRIRVEVSSSNFPRFDRNLNSSGSNSDQTKLTKAKQIIYHEKGYPSAIILPLIPHESKPHTLISHSH